jgi:methyltransferase (TIGR00027 family)
MKENCPSKTAMRVAMRRAAHQVLDDPRVFDDPLAFKILGMPNETALHPSEQTPFGRGLRAFLAARSRYVEDELQIAVARGVRQYVILGAGLDTSAYRQPAAGAELHIFEVDHPATQAWKRTCLAEAAIPIPPMLTFSPVDFETQTLEAGLQQSGFDAQLSTFIAWLGVTQYLSAAAIQNTFQWAASLPSGSSIIFDYTLSPDLLNPTARQAFDQLAQRVARAGEPFDTFFDPAQLEDSLKKLGFDPIQDMGPEEMNTRYFQGRSDGQRVGGFSHIMHAIRGA